MMISLQKRIKRFENQLDIYKQSDYNETKTRNENPLQKGVLFTWKDE